MVSSEDFSFPKISNPLPHFAISPSLWRVTSVVYPDFSEEEEEHEPEKKLTRKSFSCSFETDRDHHNQENNRLSSADEEKMDMLWEDFNEELPRGSSMDAKKLKHHLQAEISSSESCRHVRMKQQQVCSVKTMKGSNNTERRIICQPKRYNNFVVLAKVLKKIFLLQNSATNKNRR